MPVVLLIVVTLVLAFAAYRGAGVIRKHRTPPELRGDWWTRFEGEFRTYAERAAKSPRRE